LAGLLADSVSLGHRISGSSDYRRNKPILGQTTSRVVGLHMVGADAGEIARGFAVAMKAGAT
jgi:glutathione reductase (NADPH)